MAWLNVQASSRKPGAGDGDVLNRLHLGRARSETSQALPVGKGAAAAFAPVVKPRGGGISALAAAAAAAAAKAAEGPPAPRSGKHGLPVWIKEDARVLYRSSSGREMKVVVKQITPEKVKILFSDGKTWKGFLHAQVLAKDGPLRPLGASQKPRSRSRSPVRVVEVEILDD
ncbi:unnamed protein product [Effrenium voratum]|nr:unnamed protein product [Effrenium voratum]